MTKTRQERQRPTGSERGSALLIVFVMAAIIAIMLYNEMPIAVFEAQRQKEQLLIDRGNEYVHAVRLFVRANRNQYPANMEALENTNRVRYLRRRYKDPFTGKDDWRLLHAGPNGIIIDSKLKQTTAGLNNNGVTAGQNTNTGVGSNGLGVFGSNNGSASGSPFGNNTNTGGGFGNNITAGANASFAGFGSGSGGSGMGAGLQQGNQSANSSFGGGFGRNTGFGSNNTSNNNATGSGNQRGSFGGFYSQTTTPAAGQGGGSAQTSTNAGDSNPNVSDNPISAAAQRAPAIASATGAPSDSQTDGDAASESVSPAFTPRSRRPTAGQFEANLNGQQATDTGELAAQPQPSGLGNGGAGGFGAGPGGFGRNATGVGNPAGPTGPGGSAVNRGGFTAFSNTGGFGSNSSSSSQLGGIQNANLAGVASKAGGLSIKLVNDQDNYGLWEFYYDPTKDPMRGAMGVQGGGGANTQAGNTGGPAGVNNPSNNGFGNSNSGFGNNSGQNSGFGNSQGSAFGNNQNRGFGGNNSFGSGGAGNSGSGGGFSGFNSSGSNNSTVGTSSQAPVPRSSPMNQTMSTSSQP